MTEIPNEPIVEEEEVEEYVYNPEFPITTSIGNKYVLVDPVGQMGAIHISLLSQCSPSTRDENGVPIYVDSDYSRQARIFKNWVRDVMPTVVKSGPFLTSDIMPAVDQYAIFMAFVARVVCSGPLFRFDQ